jgi:HEAT repeat protein
MKRITLAKLVAVTTCALSVAAVAQAQTTTPPTPPAAPVAPPAPVRGIRPAIAPRAIDMLEVQDALDAARAVDIDGVRDAMETARAAMAGNRLDMESAREALAASRAEVDAARRFGGFSDLESLPAMPAIPAMPVLPEMPAIPEMPMLPAMRDFALFPPIARGFGDAESYRAKGFSVRPPPAPWAQGDPGDSLYRSAREALNRGDYGRAAKMFADIQQKFPKSAYVADAQYYEAFARYRIGTTDELQTAAKVLEPLASKIMTVSNNATPRQRGFTYDRRGASTNEVAALYAHINGVLAQRGDRAAADKVAKAAALNGSVVCDNDDIQVRVEALNALSQMDPNAAMPLFKRVLESKDDCSSELRRRAVFMLARRADTESEQMVIAAAKSDPSVNVRTEAINALPRLAAGAGISTLEDILRTDQNETIQRAAVRALAASDDPKVRASVRMLIERKDVPTSLRVEAITRMNSDRTTTDDAAYLRGLYAHADNDQIKDAIIGTVSRIGGADNDNWIMSIAQNQNESSQLRAAAIARLVRSSVSIADLSKLYDSAESLNVRQQVVNALAIRKEPEATDKLIDIVKNSTVLSIRTQAINALVRKNDPRGVKLLNEILDGKAP